MTPPSVHRVLAAGTWHPDTAIDSIALDYDQRHRRRLLLTTNAGRALLLDLPRAHQLRHGDALPTPEGPIAIIAANEEVMDIEAPPPTLLRIAWHLGNRHLPVQFGPATLRIRADHVIAAMVAGLGGHVHAAEAPFDPEGGAYAGVMHEEHAHHEGQ